MNAYALTGAALSGALTSLTAEPTLAEVDSWSRENRRYPHFLWAAEVIARLSETTPIWEARVELVRLLAREEWKRKSMRHLFCGNRLIALRQMIDHLEAFETRNRRPS